MGQINEGIALVKQNGSYLVRDGITITMDYLSRAVSGSEKTVPSTRLAVDLVHLFRKSMMQSSKALVHEIGKEGKAKIPDSEVRLTFLKSGYILRGYIPTLRDAELEKRCIREPRNYIITLQCVFATESFGAAGEKMNSSFLVSSDGGKRKWALGC